MFVSPLSATGTTALPTWVSINIANMTIWINFLGICAPPSIVSGVSLLPTPA
jgi:hypothetical protein